MNTTDPVLEEISDKIRRGEPVGILEALAAIDYQEKRQKVKPRRPPITAILVALISWPIIVAGLSILLVAGVLLMIPMAPFFLLCWLWDSRAGVCDWWARRFEQGTKILFRRMPL